MHLIKFFPFKLLIMVLLFGRVTSAFNFDTGNSGIEIIIPMARLIVLNDISPGVSDATIVFRLTVLLTNSWFDAIAPYHPTAVGVYTKHSHRLT